MSDRQAGGDPKATASSTARELDAQAHALRNQLNTVTMAAGLVSDEELGRELRLVAGDLVRSIDRLVVGARIELGRAPAIVELPIDELFGLAERRARRERGGEPTGVVVAGAAVTTSVRVPGIWAERLLTDLLHALAAAGASLQLELAEEQPTGEAVLVRLGCSFDALDEQTRRTAAAVGATLTQAADESCELTLPLELDRSAREQAGDRLA
ncbi:MAG: hypothetical protein ABI200_02335 [Gaiellales bacterium]